MEGFLLTYFNNGRIESVGHVWNEIDGEYFDVTINNAEHNAIKMVHEYYLCEVYSSENAKFQNFCNQGGGLYDLYAFSKQLIFKTKVKSLEKELFECLNKTQIEGC